MAIRDAALLWVMRDRLLRRGEAAALRWDDLTVEDDGSGRLTVQRSKTDQTGEGAVLWISPQTIEATERWREVAGTTSSMFDLSARSVGRVVARRAEAVGLQASGHSFAGGDGPGSGRRRHTLPGLCQAGRWAVPNNGRPLHTLPGGRPGSGGPLLPPLLKNPEKGSLTAFIVPFSPRRAWGKGGIRGCRLGPFRSTRHALCTPRPAGDAAADPHTWLFVGVWFKKGKEAPQ